MLNARNAFPTTIDSTIPLGEFSLWQSRYMPSLVNREKDICLLSLVQAVKLAKAQSTRSS